MLAYAVCGWIIYAYDLAKDRCGYDFWFGHVLTYAVFWPFRLIDAECYV